jgi:hypothetical protein
LGPDVTHIRAKCPVTRIRVNRPVIRAAE